MLNMLWVLSFTIPMVGMIHCGEVKLTRCGTGLLKIVNFASHDIHNDCVTHLTSHVLWM